MVQLKIRAGTTGAPDEMEQQESWSKLLPIVQSLIMQIMQVQSSGGDAEPMIHLLRETVKRFDDRLDVEKLIPKPPAIAATPAMPGVAPSLNQPGI
jgi:hypothetical protein